MDNAGKGIDGFAVYQHIQLHHFGLLIAGGIVIHTAKSAGQAFDAVVEIHEDFVHWDSALKHDACAVQ